MRHTLTGKRTGKLCPRAVPELQSILEHFRALVLIVKQLLPAVCGRISLLPFRIRPVPLTHRHNTHKYLEPCAQLCTPCSHALDIIINKHHCMLV